MYFFIASLKIPPNISLHFCLSHYCDPNLLRKNTNGKFLSKTPTRSRLGSHFQDKAKSQITRFISCLDKKNCLLVWMNQTTKISRRSFFHKFSKFLPIFSWLLTSFSSFFLVLGKNWSFIGPIGGRFALSKQTSPWDGVKRCPFLELSASGKDKCNNLSANESIGALASPLNRYTQVQTLWEFGDPTCLSIIDSVPVEH
jgi:hypothetical protein